MRSDKLTRRSFLASSALAAPFATRVAAAPPAEAVTPALIEAAKKEGKLAFYTAMDLPVAEKFAKAFEAKYPGIAVRVERSGAERVFQRIAQEQASNIRAVDVVNTADAAHYHRVEAQRLARALCAGGRRAALSDQRSRSRRHQRADARVALLARLQHQPGEAARTRRKASPTCSTRNGPARWSRRIRPIRARS